jgi:hypothetical protein
MHHGVQHIEETLKMHFDLPGIAEPTPQHTALPRVQGSQNSCTNTPSKPCTIALAQPAAKALQQCNGSQASQ